MKQRIRVKRQRSVGWHQLALSCSLLVLGAPAALAAELTAGPADYAAKVKTLEAGDTLTLEAGDYGRLNVSGLNGRADAWITISGPAQGQATFFANPCCNTVEITNSSYVAIVGLTIDGKDNGGSFGVSAKNGANNNVHHIRVERCTFVGHGGHQYQVAISTKTPTWGWEIRGNTIVGAGTGLYLGNSNGAEPFIGGLIEGNLIADPIGYCMQIKWQKPRPTTIGAPQTPQQTLIRHNVLIKNDQPGSVGNRPNLLVGGFPQSGPGKDDLYQIYGNFIFNNPFDALIQASGRVVVHDNVLVGAKGTALLLRNHDLPLAYARVYNNTIYGGTKGISLSGAPTVSHAVGNAVFAQTPISGTWQKKQDNLVGSVAEAKDHLKSPSLILGQMSFFPLAGKCQGRALPLGDYASDPDHELDFNGQPKGTFTFRGAYAGEGTNPGWALDSALKNFGATQPTRDAGMADSGTISDGPSAAGDGGIKDATIVPLGDGALSDQRVTSSDSSAPSNENKELGGGCALSPSSEISLWPLWWFGLLLLARGPRKTQVPDSLLRGFERLD